MATITTNRPDLVSQRPSAFLEHMEILFNVDIEEAANSFLDAKSLTPSVQIHQDEQVDIDGNVNNHFNITLVTRPTRSVQDDIALAYLNESLARLIREF